MLFYDINYNYTGFDIVPGTLCKVSKFQPKNYNITICYVNSTRCLSYIGNNEFDSFCSCRTCLTAGMQGVSSYSDPWKLSQINNNKNNYLQHDRIFYDPFN